MTTNEALVERARAVLVANIEGAIDWEDVDDLGSLTPDEAIGAMLAFAALTPPAAEGDVTQAAFTEGLWAGWRSGLAGEQMDDVYAAKSWSASDASAHLAHAAPKVAGVPTCPTCTLTDVSLERTCHNSSCAEYALPVTVYEGWPVPKPFSAAPSAPDSGEG